MITIMVFLNMIIRSRVVVSVSVSQPHMCFPKTKQYSGGREREGGGTKRGDGF